MGRFFGILICLFGISAMGLSFLGIHPVLPWRFLLLIMVVLIPYSYCVTKGIFFLQEWLPLRPRFLPPIGIFLGFLLVLGYRVGNPYFQVACLLMIIAVILDVLRWKPGMNRFLFGSILVLFLGYGAVWNSNYLLARLTMGRLHDPTILRIDLALYGWIYGHPVDQVGLFPLFESRFFFQILENAYLMLFAEIFVVLFVMFRKEENIVPFFSSVFLCYFLGLAFFFLYPVVGPCIQYPETFRSVYHGTQTHHLMRGMASEYLAIRQASSLNGFGYFVALPSLHVAIAVVMQRFLSFSPFHFWVFFPVNVLLSVSTVLLGYHYFLDLPSGILLAFIVLAPGWYWKRADRALSPRKS
jgi:membrane-associated phospholipid phosphatase